MLSPRENSNSIKRRQKSTIMKISQKQASLLAKEIVRQLKAAKPIKVSEELKNKIRAWKSQREVFKKAVEDAEVMLENHDERLEKICGADVCGHWNINQIVSKIEEKNLPKVSEVEDEIILSAMFKNEVDMQSFIA
jgi:hypothetical protein